jgi:hypothetical protein
MYSDEAILSALIIQEVFHLPLRALQGFLLFSLLRLEITSLIPPQKNAVQGRFSNSWRMPSSDAIAEIVGLGGDDEARSH